MKNVKNLKKQLGQGMTEYIIIVALIAVAAIGTFGFFGEVVQEKTAAIAAELSGQSGTANVTNGKTAGTKAIGAASKNNGHNDMGNFTAGGFDVK